MAWHHDSTKQHEFFSWMKQKCIIMQFYPKSSAQAPAQLVEFAAAAALAFGTLGLWQCFLQCFAAAR